MFRFCAILVVMEAQLVLAREAATKSLASLNTSHPLAADDLLNTPHLDHPSCRPPLASFFMTLLNWPVFREAARVNNMGQLKSLRRQQIWLHTTPRFPPEIRDCCSEEKSPEVHDCFFFQYVQNVISRNQQHPCRPASMETAASLFSVT